MCFTFTAYCCEIDSLYSILFFQRNPMVAVSTFITRNHLCQPDTAFLFVNSADLSLLMEVKFNVIKGISSVKILWYL